LGLSGLPTDLSGQRLELQSPTQPHNQIWSFPDETHQKADELCCRGTGRDSRSQQATPTPKSQLKQNRVIRSLMFLAVTLFLLFCSGLFHFCGGPKDIQPDKKGHGSRSEEYMRCDSRENLRASLSGSKIAVGQLLCRGAPACLLLPGELSDGHGTSACAGQNVAHREIKA